MIIAIDFETIPNPDALTMMPDPEVQLGNTKDLITADEWRAKLEEYNLQDARITYDLWLRGPRRVSRIVAILGTLRAWWMRMCSPRVQR